MSWQCFLPKKIDISKQQLKNAFDKNDDGAGIGWAKNGELFIAKGFFTFEDFYKKYEEIGLDCVRAIFFRWGMIGGKTEENCQPLQINKGLFFTQSGNLSNFYSKGDKSDVYIYNEDLLRPFFKDNHKLIHKPEIQWLITQSCGTANKLVFLTKEGSAVIVNADKGKWDDKLKNVWYSNDEHEKEKYISPSYHNSVNYSGHTSMDYNKEETKGTLGLEETYPFWLRKCYDEAVKQKEMAI